MAKQYECIAQVTVGAGGATWIDFTSIPSTYTDLKLVVSNRSDGSNNYFVAKFNGDTGTYSYLSKEMYGSGSGVAGGGWGTVAYWGFFNKANSTANTFGQIEMYITNYASSKAKNVSIETITENNATAAFQSLHAGNWVGTSAITSVSIRPDAPNNWAQYTTAHLYGIKNS
jgi:hypothetical protein